MSEIREQIMQLVVQSSICSLDDLVRECDGLTWNQVFSEVDRMSRSGEVRLDLKGPGLYTVASIQKPVGI